MVAVVGSALALFQKKFGLLLVDKNGHPVPSAVRIHAGRTLVSQRRTPCWAGVADSAKGTSAGLRSRLPVQATGLRD